MTIGPLIRVHPSRLDGWAASVFPALVPAHFGIEAMLANIRHFFLPCVSCQLWVEQASLDIVMAQTCCPNLLKEHLALNHFFFSGISQIVCLELDIGAFGGIEFILGFDEDEIVFDCTDVKDDDEFLQEGVTKTCFDSGSASSFSFFL